MLRFVVRRLVQVVPVLLVLSLLAFAWLRALPGGTASAFLGGLDQPIPVQYRRFLGRVLSGDLGSSTVTGQPVLAEIGRALPATVELSVAALLIAVLLGVPLGHLAAQRPGGPVDVAAVLAAPAAVVVPVFVLGHLLQSFFAVQLGWFPAAGRHAGTVDATHVTGLAVLDGLLTGEFGASLDALGHLVLPAVALAAIPLAVIVRRTRASVLDALGSDFARTAHATGLAPGTVRSRHVLRNALLPAVERPALPVGLLLGGAVLTEKVFAWGGVGTLLSDAVMSRDYPRLHALLLLGALVYVLVNLLVDLACAVVDPRVRLPG